MASTYYPHEYGHEYGRQPAQRSARSRDSVAVRAARSSPPLPIGARVLMEDNAESGKIVEVEVARQLCA